MNQYEEKAVKIVQGWIKASKPRKDEEGKVRGADASMKTLVKVLAKELEETQTINTLHLIRDMQETLKLAYLAKMETENTDVYQKSFEARLAELPTALFEDHDNG